VIGGTRNQYLLSKHLIRRLTGPAELSPNDQEDLDRLGQQRVRYFLQRTSIIEEDERSESFYLIHEGWACGYKALEDGRRQIIAFYLPGDICHLNGFVLGRMDYSIGTITAATISEITQRTYDDLVERKSSIATAICREFLVGFAVQREWTFNIAQRDALARVAHLICELFLRLKRVGLTNGDSCEFPLTQIDLGEALGLTAIHVNRMLQQLRANNLVVFKERQLTIPDIKALQRVAAFNDNYLHL
jgi:CRP-like cAMP-binding protein